MDFFHKFDWFILETVSNDVSFSRFFRYENITAYGGFAYWSIIFKVVNGLFKAEGDYSFDDTDRDLYLTNKVSFIAEKSLLK